MTISTSVWSGQNPNAGRNIQQPGFENTRIVKLGKFQLRISKSKLHLIALYEFFRLAKN